MDGEAEFLDYVDALARRLTPLIAVAYLKTLRDLAFAIDVDAFARLLREGRITAAVALVVGDPVFAAGVDPMQIAIRDVVARAGRTFYRDTPVGPASAVPIARIRFQVLDPNVVRAVEAYESAVFAKMGETMRATVRQAVEAGVRDGVNPRAIARGIKDVIGLAPNQEQFIRNYRAELIALDPAALRRELTDGNFDRTLAKAIREERSLTAAEVEKGVARYRANWQRWQAETVSRTVTLNAMREAQRLAWQQAIDSGKVEEPDLIETWITTLDGRERATHHQMHGRQKRFNELWIVPGAGPQRYPGETEYNCRCRTWISVRIRHASGGPLPT